MRENRLDTMHVSLERENTVKDILECVKKVYKYIQFSFITHNGKTLLNCSDSERYQSQLSTTIQQLIDN